MLLVLIRYSYRRVPLDLTIPLGNAGSRSEVGWNWVILILLLFWKDESSADCGCLI